MPDERCHSTGLATLHLEHLKLEPLTGSPATAYLGLGSNVGRRRANLAMALGELSAAGQVRLAGCSSLYETEPWGYTEQPAFLNCAAAVETTLAPVRLLELVKGIEERLGRRPGIRYGPRPIDIDILLYADRIIHWETPDLWIPHPRLAERAFALIPLAEISGPVVHPELKAPIAELARRVEGTAGVKLWGPPPWSG